MRESHTRRVLVVNGKGGCGKSTIATNLATACANSGRTVVLMDYDAQASSSHWHQHRSANLAEVRLIEAHQPSDMYVTRSFQTRIPPNTDDVIIDSPSGIRDVDIERLLRKTSAVIVPVLPSSIDIRAGARFISKLLTHKAYRRKPIPVGVVANRVKPNTECHAKLTHFLGCLDIPAIATFRDSQLYNRLAEQGLGLFDPSDSRSTKREMREWQNLLQWLEPDSLARQKRNLSPQPLRQGPRTVGRSTSAHA